MRRLTIASSLVDLQNARLRAHPSAPRLIPLSERPWQVPDEADALFTYQTQWKSAPAEAPTGWPGRLAWMQIASAGVDTFPRWIHAVPLVTRGRGVQSPAIAEYVVGAIYAHEKQFWDGRVGAAAQWRHRVLGAVAGKRLGIAGLGAIGSAVASTALALGMRVSALTRSGTMSVPGLTGFASIEELMACSDHLVLALPLTAQTRGIVGARSLAAAKPGLHIINVSRGALIDDEALLAAIATGRVAAATLDVTSPEPLPSGHAFYTHPAIRLTPHVAGMTEDNEERLSRVLLANLDAYLANQPVPGVVDPAHGY